MSTQRVPQRSEIAVKDTWDAASVFASFAAWEAEIDRISTLLPTLAAHKGHLGDSPAALADWLTIAEDVLVRTQRLYVYASMFFEVDTADQTAAAMRDRVIGLFAQVSAAVSFTEPELLEVGFETLRKWIKEEPRLAIYEHYLDALERLQAHVRSAEVEEVLGLVQDPFGTASATHGILADADVTFAPARNSKGESVPVDQGNIDALLTDHDREVRRTAFENYADAHLKLKNTMANCISAGVKQNVFNARARRYPSSLEAALTPNHIPVQVYYALIETYKKHLPVWHRYWAIRRRALGLELLAPYDIKAPLTEHPPHVSFDQAFDWVVEGMKPLGDEYISVLKRGVLEERWVDKYPNKGKRAGAFSTGAPGTHPYILMSHNDDIYGMSTLAHELGHSLHSYFTWTSQPLAYADYSIFVAEVASNFNQALVRAHLLETNTDKDFQIAVIEEAMSNFHRYFFIMPTLARFELELHERSERGEPLTADTMISLLDGLFREGYGSEVAEDPQRIGITWAEFPSHLYMNFYVFQYATGISGAHALAERVLAGEPGAVDRYLAFLKAGSSGFPLDVLKAAGVDLTSPEPVERTFGELSKLVDRLEKLVG
ncbi:MAG: oligoendopeptidase [Chloroflexi bacterium]|nr:oligoendopeptidase [Chloroflexota bacterium]